jgi:kynurenine 3-monooxygenase
MANNTVHVVGSGLAGSLMAVFLGKKGFNVELYERRADMRKEEMSAGRSINLALTDRGIQALEKVGLKDKIMDMTIPMRGRILHDTEGQTTFVPYGQKEHEIIHSLSRGLLNSVLMDAAEENNHVNIHFNHHCTEYNPKESILTFETGEEEQIVHADVTIAADGAFSAVRKSLLDNVMNFDYSQSFLEYGYKELCIPPNEKGEWAMEREALHIWPRKNYMLIALPNLDNSFTCTLFYPYEGENSFAKLKTKEDVQTFFERDFPDALALMPTLTEDFFSNPTGALATIKCNPWHIGGKALVIGDAAHAIVPFFGQGMNCSFEDCSVLDSLITEGEENWEKVFSDLNEERKPSTDAIADMALENFVEMRSTTADPKFQLKKKVGFELEKRFPEKFIPRYSMVMFHPEIPYAEARRRSQIQDKILNQLCENITEPEQLDWEKASNLVETAAY